MSQSSTGQSVDVAAGARVDASPRRSGLSREHREWLAGYLFVLPDLVGLILFLGVPMVLSLSLGFFEVDGFGHYDWIGLRNYRDMFHDDLFLKSLRVTGLYVVLLVPGLFITGMGLALLVKLVGEVQPAAGGDDVMPVSVNSPMGDALMKARIGDVVKVKAPRGTMEFKILEIL